MAPSLVDHSVAPPGYSSQRDSTSPLHLPDSPSDESADEIVSSQTHRHPRALSVSSAHATPRNSDVHFDQNTPAIQRSRTAASRRRYTLLPYGGSTVTFPVHLTYHPSDAGSTVDTPEREPEPDLPAFSSPSMHHLHEKLVSGTPTSRGHTIRLNPANYISLSRKSTPKRFLALARSSTSIKGKFTVNPYLHVPAALLASSPVLSGRGGDGTDGVRKNLKFEVENGGIDVEIFLVGEPDPELEVGVGDTDIPVLRTTLDLKLRAGVSKKNNFPLIAKIHTPTPHRPPFHLTASAHDGYLSIHLPPSFHGLLTINIKPINSAPNNHNHDHGPHLPLDAHISLSPMFYQNSMILSETGMTRAYFVGEMGGWGREQQEWGGDRVDVGVGGGLVRLQVLGESDWDTVRRMRWKIGI